jgi:hypothetical protein
MIIMVMLQIELTKQESDKLAMLKIAWNKKHKQEVLHQILRDIPVRIQEYDKK